MNLLRRYLIEERSEILDNDIRLTAVGELDRLPKMVLGLLTELIETSANNQGMTLCLALSYGGRETIAAAAQAMCRAAAAGRLDPDDVDPELFGRYLPSSNRLPPLDLLIRTSGERRISNFFLWEVAYAELYFTPVMWPDFGETDLWKALSDYATRDRRFGLIPGQRSG